MNIFHLKFGKQVLALKQENVNEVIANSYSNDAWKGFTCHPNDHVNKASLQ